MLSRCFRVPIGFRCVCSQKESVCVRDRELERDRDRDRDRERDRDRDRRTLRRNELIRGLTSCLFLQP
jgi:hypothetical protein